MRGELSLARETAESFLRDAENQERTTEAVVAHRSVGFTRLFQGDFIGAEANLPEALRIYDPERDRDSKFRFGMDIAAAATGYLAWQAGLWATSNGRERSARRRWRARTRPPMRPPGRSFTTSSPSTRYSAATLKPSLALRRFLSA
jgi:hypothetical protein